MIVSKDINPERDVYYLGAKIIEVIDASEGNKVDFFEVFERVNATEKISINLYALTLDWLFLIGIITKTEKGSIEKCF
jgi:hypothetical protein